MNNLILPACCFGNVFYFNLLVNESCVIDVHENYLKQTWRNRYDIMGANGTQSLTIPVVGQKGEKIATKDILIDNQLLWQRNHLRTIQAAYGSSPFYEHYIDDLAPLFNQNHEKLIDFNLQASQLVWNFLEMSKPLVCSKSYVDNNTSCIDLRYYFKPSKFEKLNFKPLEYIQTFSNKFKFAPNLSILDMIFNVGPDAVRTLISNKLKADQIIIFDPQ